MKANIGGGSRKKIGGTQRGQSVFYTCETCPACLLFLRIVYLMLLFLLGLPVTVPGPTVLLALCQLKQHVLAQGCVWSVSTFNF